MREIKFRAWKHVNTPEMFNDVQVIDFESGIAHLSYGLSSFTERTDKERLDNLILMQYTGNTDKNGNEIYEDDLVAEEHGRIYRVVFKGDCWRCEPLSRGSKNRWLSNYLEIIGNIYENPELWKKAKDNNGKF